MLWDSVLEAICFSTASLESTAIALGTTTPTGIFHVPYSMLMRGHLGAGYENAGHTQLWIITAHAEVDMRYPKSYEFYFGTGSTGNRGKRQGSACAYIRASSKALVRVRQRSCEKLYRPSKLLTRGLVDYLISTMGLTRELAIVFTVVFILGNAMTPAEGAVEEKKRPSATDLLRETCLEGATTCMKAVARFMSNPIVLNEVAPVFEQRMPTPYKVTARLLSRPLAQPYGEKLFELSFVVKDDHVTEELNDAISVCMTEATGGLGRRWGLFNVDQFSRGLFQLEYFVFAKDYAEDSLKGSVAKYMAEGGLTRCVRRRAPEMKEKAKVVYARRVTSSLPHGVHTRTGSSRWAFYLIGGLFVLDVALLCVARKMTQRRRAGFKRQASKWPQGTSTNKPMKKRWRRRRRGSVMHDTQMYELREIKCA
eukprot:IDg6063t1